MGAAQGWLYSAWDFVEQCTECYRCRHMASRSSTCSSCLNLSVGQCT